MRAQALGGAVEGVTRDALNKLFDLNLFGLIATTQAVLPLMRSRSSGVIVNVSSVAGRFGLPFLAPYCASKYAVEGFTEAMRYELAAFGIRVKLVEAGGVKTTFTHVWAQGSAYDPLAALVRDRYAAGAQKAAGAGGVAEVIFRAATDGSPRLRYTANGAGLFLTLNRVLPDGIWRAMMRTSFSRRPRSGWTDHHLPHRQDCSPRLAYWEACSNKAGNRCERPGPFIMVMNEGSVRR